MISRGRIGLVSKQKNRKKERKKERYRAIREVEDKAIYIGTISRLQLLTQEPTQLRRICNVAVGAGRNALLATVNNSND
jgi:hypothetical protein